MDFNRLIPELSASHFEKSLSFYTDTYYDFLSDQVPGPTKK